MTKENNVSTKIISVHIPYKGTCETNRFIASVLQISEDNKSCYAGIAVSDCGAHCEVIEENALIQLAGCRGELEKWFHALLAKEKTGLTSYCYDVDGNEFWYENDFKRHYTRLEG